MLKRRIINGICVALLLAMLVLNFFFQIPWWSFVVLLFIWFLITLGGSFFIQWNYHLNSLHSNKSIPKNQIALTFDDGPHPEFTPMALDLLKAHKARATFFCIGHHIEKHPELFKRILAEGHTVGNHTYSHSKSFGFFGTEKVIDELKQTKALVKKLTGKSMNLYRPAFGVTNPVIERTVKQLDIVSIGWNVRSLDTTSRPEKLIMKRITSRLSKGDVILLHDTSHKTINVLEQLLLFLEEKNLESVTIEELLQLKAYA